MIAYMFAFLNSAIREVVIRFLAILGSVGFHQETPPSLIVFQGIPYPKCPYLLRIFILIFHCTPNDGLVSRKYIRVSFNLSVNFVKRLCRFMSVFAQL